VPFSDIVIIVSIGNTAFVCIGIVSIVAIVNIVSIVIGIGIVSSGVVSGRKKESCSSEEKWATHRVGYR
jgi:hypothetical protein